MPDLFDNQFKEQEPTLRAGPTSNAESLIRSLLARSGGAGAGLGTPVSGMPFSGMPTFSKAPILSTDFAQPQRSAPPPETPFLPPPSPQFESRPLKVGAAMGEGMFDKPFQQGPTKSPGPNDDELKRIRDALAASQNALADLYKNPSPSAAQPKATNMQDPNATGSEENYRYNLGNIRTSDSGWLGKGSPYNGFETFETPFYGARALYKNLGAYIYGVDGKGGSPDMTVAQAINKYAPPKENNTSAYIAFLQKEGKIDPKARLSDILRDPAQAGNLMYWMGRMEHGKALPQVFTPDFLSSVASSVIGENQ
jgi:hypothetical protein